MASLSSWAPNTCIEHLRSRFYLIWEPIYKYFRFCGSPYLISDFRLHRAISAMAPMSSWAPKTWVKPLRSRFYLILESRYKYFRFIGRHLEYPTSGYIEHHPLNHPCVPEPRKHKTSRYNFVSICLRAPVNASGILPVDLLPFPVWRPPACISASTLYRTASQEEPLSCPTSKR